jgi:glycosyltransferase involved in cell wall biosynthesis
MRVLVLSQHFWPESFRITGVALDLQALGHAVTVLTGQPNYPGGRVFDGYCAAAVATEHHAGLEIHRVPLVPRGERSAVRLVANYLSFIASAAVFGSWLLRRRRFDVVFVYGTSPILQAIAGVFIAWNKRCALVTWVQDLWPQSLAVTGYVRNPRALAVVARVVRWIYARSDLLLVQSRGFEAPVRALAPPDAAVRLHPNPGDASQQAPEPAEAALRLPAGFNVVFAGNLGTVQALDTVIDAAQLLLDTHADVRIVLVGSGALDDWIATQVAARRLTNVHLPGRFEAAAMAGIFAQADALLVSLRRDETMELTIPSKVQSYLAAGRPIVASLDGEGARTVADAGAGLVCPAGDAAALAAAIGRLHDMPAAERQRMGDAGRIYFAQHFDPARLAAALVQHFQDAQALRARRRGDNDGLDKIRP